MFKRIILACTLALAFTACGDDDDDTTDSVAGPRGAENRPALGAQIDRSGRAVATALIDAFNGDEDARGAAKDSYNQASPSMWSSFQGSMRASLAILDSLDTVCGDNLVADLVSPRYTALAGVLADDQLYVNTASGTCGVYLGLEAEFVGAIGSGAGGCGGRAPDDDVIARSYSVLSGPTLADVDDTIIANDVANSASFPFLAPAN
ncbi:MAG: hypothetical protein AAF658_10495 [Myxococcota bacterium]